MRRTEVVARAYAAQDPARPARVRYEELLADAPGHLERVAAAVGLRTSPARVGEIASALRFGEGPAAERGGGRLLRAANLGGWREDLDEAEQHALLEVVEPKLRELGYVAGRQTAAA